MRGSVVAFSCSAPTITAEAPVAASRSRYRAFERNAIWPRAGRSSEPTCVIRTPASPAMRPPSCVAICASVSGPGMSFGGRFGVQRLDHLVGDVDARVCVGGFLEDDVVFLRLGDLADDAVRLLDHLRQLLVAALVDVFAVFALLALEVAVQLAEITLLVAPLRLGHRDAVLFQLILHALELVGNLGQLRLALGKLCLELFLCAQGRAGIAHDALDLDHADLALGEAGARRSGEAKPEGGK